MEPATDKLQAPDSRGIVSSPKIEAACRNNFLGIAISGDRRSNFAIRAAFVSEVLDVTDNLLGQVLTLWDRQNQICREMFASDCVTLPADASKAKYGTREDIQRQLRKMEQAAEKMLNKHREADDTAADTKDKPREAGSRESLPRDAKKLREGLKKRPEYRKCVSGETVRSNHTDNESAKMATGINQALLMPVVDAVKHLRTPATVLTADAGYRSETNLENWPGPRIPPISRTTITEKATSTMPSRKPAGPNPTHATTNASGRRRLRPVRGGRFPDRPGGAYLRLPRGQTAL